MLTAKRTIAVTEYQKDLITWVVDAVSSGYIDPNQITAAIGCAELDPSERDSLAEDYSDILDILVPERKEA